MHEEYASQWKKRLQEQRRKLAARKQDALGSAELCAEILGEKYRATRVYGFGSLWRDEEFDQFSDIDLGVEGLSPEKYFSVLAELDDYLPPDMELDLIPMESAHEALKERIVREGEVLYERK